MYKVTYIYLVNIKYLEFKCIVFPRVLRQMCTKTI